MYILMGGQAKCVILDRKILRQLMSRNLLASRRPSINVVEGLKT